MESSDYSFTPSEIIFPSESANNTMKCADVTITDDTALEGNQTFTVILSTLNPGVVLEDSETLITIEDDDSVLLTQQKEYIYFYHVSLKM